MCKGFSCDVIILVILYFGCRVAATKKKELHRFVHASDVVQVVKASTIRSARVFCFTVASVS